MRRAVCLFTMFALFSFLALSLKASAPGFYAAPGDEEEKDGPLSGVYHLRGEENGKIYYGVCVIQDTKGSEIVHCVHVIGTGITHGIGMRKGDTLSIAWKQTYPDAKSMGITVYSISKDGKSLDGGWAAPGVDSPRKEALKFLRKVKDQEV